VLGLVLGGIGLARVLLMPAASVQTHEHEVLLAVTVATSLVWIVLWGAIVGAMLPFLLRGLGFDPASASAPFVATLSDVTGIVIYFSVATVLLTGTLL
jgi:magnesium transporter